MNEKKALVLLATGFEEIEAAGIIDVLRRGGVETPTVSITGDKTVVGAHNIPFVADELFENVATDNYDVIILPGGGPGSEMLNRHEGVRKALVDYGKSGKYMAAICAAPRVFGSLGLLKGKKATCYPGIEPELTGATICDSDVVTDPDGYPVTTGRGPGVVFDFALEVLRCLKGDAGAPVADSVAKAMLLP